MGRNLFDILITSLSEIWDRTQAKRISPFRDALTPDRVLVDDSELKSKSGM